MIGGIFILIFKKGRGENMKKLFISQPMKGKSDADILAERQKAIKSAEEKIGEPVEVIDLSSRKLQWMRSRSGFLENPWNF